MKNEASVWHEAAYRKAGIQRKWPNEELVRFFGRNYFQLPLEQRVHTKVVEMGCGTGANLKMVLAEGFDGHGVDSSETAIAISALSIDRARLKVCDIRNTGHRNADAVLDVFSSYCLTEDEFKQFIVEVSIALKPGGRFFAYTPSKGSDVYKRTADRIDASTLNGIPQGNPYGGNNYPFRFVSSSELSDQLRTYGLRTEYTERVGRTYDGGNEYFEFVVMEAVKC